MLRHLPDCMQADITYERYKDVFFNIKPFKFATTSCMRAIAKNIKVLNLQVNNYVIRQGDELNQIYILAKGSLEVFINGDLMEMLGKNKFYLPKFFW